MKRIMLIVVIIVIVSCALWYVEILPQRAVNRYECIPTLAVATTTAAAAAAAAPLRRVSVLFRGFVVAGNESGALGDDWVYRFPMFVAAQPSVKRVVVHDKFNRASRLFVAKKLEHAHSKNIDFDSWDSKVVVGVDFDVEGDSIRDEAWDIVVCRHCLCLASAGYVFKSAPLVKAFVPIGKDCIVQMKTEGVDVFIADDSFWKPVSDEYRSLLYLHAKAAQDSSASPLTSLLCDKKFVRKNRDKISLSNKQLRILTGGKCERRKVLLYPANFAAFKRQVYFMNSVNATLSKDNYVVVFAGTDREPIRRQLLSIGEQRGIPTLILGRVNHFTLSLLYQRSFSIILMSLVDPNPRIIAEALLAGVPALVSSHVVVPRRAHGFSTYTANHIVTVSDDATTWDDALMNLTSITSMERFTIANKWHFLLKETPIFQELWSRIYNQLYLKSKR